MVHKRYVEQTVREWDMRGHGLCVECGDKHGRDTYRCKKCTRRCVERDRKRTGRMSRDVICGMCGEAGHMRPTCATTGRGG